jgi:hypothetical protein
VTWFCYCVTDKARDRFDELWRDLDSRLPDSWERR